MLGGTSSEWRRDRTRNSTINTESDGYRQMRSEVWPERLNSELTNEIEDFLGLVCTAKGTVEGSRLEDQSAPTNAVPPPLVGQQCS